MIISRGQFKLNTMGILFDTKLHLGILIEIIKYALTFSLCSSFRYGGKIVLPASFFFLLCWISKKKIE